MPNDNDTPVGPAFFVEYFPNDFGLRPLPASAVSWECPGIHLDGLTRAARGPILPGSNVDLSVQVGNAGTVSGRATVSIYWAALSAAIGPVQLKGGLAAFFSEQRNVGDPPAFTAPRVWKTRPDLPPHVCLLVKVESTADIAPTTTSLNDRHYAQQNLTFLTVGRNAPPPLLPFQVGNPGPAARAFRVRPHPLPAHALEQLGAITGKVPIAVSITGVRLGPPGQAGGAEFTTELASGSVTACVADLTSVRMDPGQVGGVAFVQADAETGAVVGSLAVVLTAAEG